MSESTVDVLPELKQIVGALLFIPFIGNMPLFDWDEINFAECAREMLLTKEYFSVKINYQPFWEKPPIFIWMQALSTQQLLGNQHPGVVSEVGERDIKAMLQDGSSVSIPWEGLSWAAPFIDRGRAWPRPDRPSSRST